MTLSFFLRTLSVLLSIVVEYILIVFAITTGPHILEVNKLRLLVFLMYVMAFF